MSTSHTMQSATFFSDNSKVITLPVGKQLLFPQANTYQLITSDGIAELNFFDTSEVIEIWHFVQKNCHGICVISKQNSNTDETTVTVYTHAEKKTDVTYDIFCGFDVAHCTIAFINKMSVIRVYDAPTLTFLFQTPSYICCLHKIKNNLVEISSNSIIFIDNNENFDTTIIKFQRGQTDFTRTNIRDTINNSHGDISAADLLQVQCKLMFYANNIIWYDLIDDPNFIVTIDLNRNLVKKVLIPAARPKPIFQCKYMSFTNSYMCMWQFNNIQSVVIMTSDGHQYFCKDYNADIIFKLILIEFSNAYAVLNIDNSKSRVELLDWIPFGLLKY